MLKNYFQRTKITFFYNNCHWLKYGDHCQPRAQKHKIKYFRSLFFIFFFFVNTAALYWRIASTTDSLICLFVFCLHFANNKILLCLLSLVYTMQSITFFLFCSKFILRLRPSFRILTPGKLHVKIYMQKKKTFPFLFFSHFSSTGKHVFSMNINKRKHKIFRRSVRNKRIE